MFQNFILKQMLKKQGVPPEQIDLLLRAMNKKPELFKKIAEEVKKEIDSGKDQQQAAMEIFSKHKDELSEVLK